MSQLPGANFQIPLVAGRIGLVPAELTGPLALALWCAGVTNRATMGFEVSLRDPNTGRGVVAKLGPMFGEDEE